MVVFQDSEMRYPFDFRNRVLFSTKVLYSLRRTRSRIQIRSTLTCVIIFFENLSAREILK